MKLAIFGRVLRWFRAIFLLRIGISAVAFLLPNWKSAALRFAFDQTIKFESTWSKLDVYDELT